jgi:hypothetical protein
MWKWFGIPAQTFNDLGRKREESKALGGFREKIERCENGVNSFFSISKLFD